jgi:hypothetical protein
VVFPASRRISVPRGTQGQRRKSSSLSPTGLSPSMTGLSSAFRLETRFVTSLDLCRDPVAPYNPHHATAAALPHGRFGLIPVRSPLLRESFPFLEVLRWFSSLRAPRLAYVFSQRYPGFAWVGSPIRVSPDRSLLTAPRGLSQSTTPFIGS